MTGKKMTKNCLQNYIHAFIRMNEYLMSTFLYDATISNTSFNKNTF